MLNLNPISQVSKFIPYLENKEVKAAFDKFIRQVNRDADEVGFEMSTPTEQALKELIALVDEIEDKKETPASKKMADADMGEPDDEE